MVAATDPFGESRPWPGTALPRARRAHRSGRCARTRAGTAGIAGSAARERTKVTQNTTSHVVENTPREALRGRKLTGMQVIQSTKLANVCYEIRGPVLEEAMRLEAAGTGFSS